MNKGLILFTLAAIGLMVGLVVTYAGQVSLLYLKADEVFKRLDASAATQHKGPDSLVGKQLRIHGHLKPKTTRRHRGRVDYRFEIMDKKSGRSIEVSYKGILPDTFRDGAELVLEGKLVRANFFKAYSVFAKCPTKYKESKGAGYKKQKKLSSAM